MSPLQHDAGRCRATRARSTQKNAAHDHAVDFRTPQTPSLVLAPSRTDGDRQQLLASRPPRAVAIERTHARIELRVLDF